MTNTFAKKTFSQGRAKSEQSIGISIEQSNTTSSSRRKRTIAKIAKSSQQGQDEHCKTRHRGAKSVVNMTANMGK